jgi:DNA polymerase-3 subunit delta'
MVGEGGQLPLPWLADPLRSALETQHAHALLIHGPAGVGQFELAMTLAQAWLCEADELPGSPGAVAAASSKPCGRCASCRLFNVRSHPDLMVLLPPLLRDQMGWGTGTAGEGEGEAAGSSEAKASKTKPSKEIKVDPVRAAVSFAQTSSARGRAKVIVIYPAERMNAIAANTLLKTLEEPPGMARFLLASGSPDSLLPTIRSRCQAVHMPIPDTQLALQWLGENSIKGAEVLLAAAGGQPLEALAWARDGVDAAAWQALPHRAAAGDGSGLAGWPLPRAVEALQKLCHDAMLMAAGAEPRYFSISAMPKPSQLQSLSAWSRSLQEAASQAEHPWSVGLMVEAMIQEARHALRIL